MTNRFTPLDVEQARLEYDSEHAVGSFDRLPTRKRNRLSEDQKYHREYRELSLAIMQVRQKN